MLEEDEPVAAELSINKKFAVKYDQRKRREELGRAEELGLLSESESESESEDEGQLLTKKRDLEIHRVLEMIRARDPRIYDSSTALYDEAEDDAERTQSSGDPSASSALKKPRVTVRSMAGHMLQRDGTLESEDEGEEEEEEEVFRGARHSRLEKNRNLAYNEEQRNLRSTLLKELHGESGGEEGVAGEEEEEDLFSKRRSAPSMDEAGISERLLEDDKVASTFSVHDKERLRRFITAPAQKEDDEFLRQFMVNRMWEDRDAMSLPRYRDIVGEDESGAAPGADEAPASRGKEEGEEEDEADLEEVERADDFEREFNFRFEEPDAPGEGVEDRPHLQSFPRGGVEGSMRRQKTKRREARKLREERKAAEKKRIEEELRRLKNIKKRELEAKLNDLAEVSGKQEGATFHEEDLDGEWDPEQHDRRMAELFGEDYYEEEEAEPHASAAGAEGGPTDAAAREEGAAAAGGGEGEGEEDQDEGDWVPRPADEEWAQGNEGQGEGASGVKEERDALLDELYGLDHEDIVAGMPTRFKYRHVPNNDYGLSAQEILALPDPDLNTFVSLKKLHPYREQEWRPDRSKRKWVRRRFRDVAKEWEKGAEKGKKAAERRKEHRDKRKRSRTELEAAAGEKDGEDETQPSGFEEGAGTAGDAGDAPKAGKRRRKKRGKGKGNGKGQTAADDGERSRTEPEKAGNPVESAAAAPSHPQGREERRKGRGRKASKASAKKLSKQTGVAADRLSAYGL